jgi:hypothetical protein
MPGFTGSRSPEFATFVAFANCRIRTTECRAPIARLRDEAYLSCHNYPEFGGVNPQELKSVILAKDRIDLDKTSVHCLCVTYASGSKVGLVTTTC